MRQLHVQVQRQDADRVVEIANRHEAFAPAVVDAHRPGTQPRALVILSVPNRRVGAFVEAVADAVDEAEFVVPPRGVIVLEKPLSEALNRARRIAHRSTLELVLSSLQSVGTWQSLLLYAVFSGAIGSYAVITSTSYLLIAAMLISPLGGPAMVCVVATAIGDREIFRRGALRFVAAMCLLAATGALVGALYRLDGVTTLMQQISNLSAWTVLLAVVGGAAGAQSQVQSDRDSLVTGTATGFLVAVALSPPAAVLGLAVVLERWDHAGQMAFVVLLTFIGILVGGWLSLRLYGVAPRDPGVVRGSASVRTLLGGGAIVGVLLLVGWQTGQVPELRKADVSRDAVALVGASVRELEGVRLVQASAEFVRPEIEGIEGEALVLDVLVTRVGASAQTTDEEVVREAVRRRILSQLPGVVPFVQVTSLPGPNAGEP